MSKNQGIKEKLTQSILLFDGGMGTELYNRGIFINKCFEELNISNPTIVKQIHTDYKKAGADVLETNTFGANRYKLKTYQLFDKIYKINYEGARIAREIAGDDLYVAGAIGPLGVRIEPLGAISNEEPANSFQNR
jgi:homocysteine S-methyltransferase